MTGTIRDLNPEVHHPMVEALHLSLLACTCSLMMERGGGLTRCSSVAGV